MQSIRQENRKKHFFINNKDDNNDHSTGTHVTKIRRAILTRKCFFITPLRIFLGSATLSIFGVKEEM